MFVTFSVTYCRMDFNERKKRKNTLVLTIFKA